MTTAFEWLHERQQRNPCTVNRIQFDELDNWDVHPGSGNIAHRSGRFFTIEGLDVSLSGTRWSQPIIRQEEIAILGILARRRGRELDLLMQAKTEPGNINGVQISPTVQATRSNFTRVHQGDSTHYLEFFTRNLRAQVSVDLLQSEHGIWNYRKRNRNMVVETTEDVPALDNFRWFSLDELRSLLATDNTVNMDARSVLACLPATRADPDEGARHTLSEIMSWLHDLKMTTDMRARPVDLDKVAGWRRDGAEISGGPFSVIAVSVEAPGREVCRWTQPMIAPRARNVVAFMMHQFNGVPHVLVHADQEPGSMDGVELGPTINRPPHEDHDGLLAEVLAGCLRFDAVLSEEGGRFHHAESRYVIAETDTEPEARSQHRWVTASQLEALARSGYLVNIQARSLLTCLRSL